ncbi:MAG TPA: DNA repair protein RadA [Polyangiales bacterium]|nr:DNA repair protein RadA [Polyangiales bacterium]
MPKAAKTLYECQACGATSPKWLGRCSGCGGWNTLEETRVSARAPSGVAAKSGGGGRPVPLAEIQLEEAPRMSTGLGELDRVLGGGVVRGGVTLLGGDPGIGKSTLLMQALAGMAGEGRQVLYVTGEESAAQVALRARRLRMQEDFAILASTELDDALAALSGNPPALAVIDSIQTMRAAELESAPGSVAQLREVAARLTEIAKQRDIALFLIGHVTKDGSLAGPKVLEHLVDTVLSFEGDPSHAYRIVRTTKNRFGAAHELGVFEMARDGLREVPNASALFIAERPVRAAGSVVVPVAQGSRPLLVEVQALVAPALYGAPRRVATGLDATRLAVLLAVLQRRAGLAVLDLDVFASAAGGARVDEPAVDLALCAAVASSQRDRPVPADTVVFGEVGLTGELRGVGRPGSRLAEAQKLGFKRAVLPKACLAQLADEERDVLELTPVSDLQSALAALFD